ncbi:MAG: TauD/TfdA family dioxygenase [Gammaproteobacteria bacterium]|nr:TauD/TfdA family dioxygenase [Gammaproteobacteria bacterium]
MNSEYRTLKAIPVSREVGAEISRVDIAAGISDEQFSELKQAFSDYGVIFLRDQDITPDQHIEFARRWGEINVNRFFQPVETHPQIAEVRKEPHQKANIGAAWHTDHSYDQIPAMGSILYAREVPELGGDTLFSSMYAACDALSDGMKKMLLGMRAEHSSRHVFGEQAYDDKDVEDVGGRLGNTGAATQDAIHPVIIRHPLSGRSALYVNGDFTVKFEGWTKAESQPLLDFLYQHASQNEFTCRFQWQKGSMAIWDNRATHHYAMNDYQGELRLMHRITIQGEALGAAD